MWIMCEFYFHTYYITGVLYEIENSNNNNKNERNEN